MEGHCDAKDWPRLLASPAPGQLWGKELLHLATCSECRRRLRAFDPEGAEELLCWLATRGRARRQQDVPQNSEETYARLDGLGPEWAAEAAAAPGLSAELLAVPEARRWMVAANTRRFQTLGVVAHLLLEAEEQQGHRPEMAEERAELAAAILAGLRRNGQARYPEPLRADFEAHARESLAAASRRCRERREARALWAKRRPSAVELRQSAVEEGEGFETLGGVEVLLEEARAAWTSAPEEAEALAELALEISGRLDAEVYGGKWIEDCRARGFAYLGNARRVRSDLAGADEALEVAREILELGTGDVLERAMVLELESSLRRAQRRFEEAMELTAEAAKLYQLIGDRQNEAQMRVLEAFLEREVGGLDESISTLRALLLGATRREIGDRLYLMALHNLATNLAQAGRPEEARRYLPEIRHLAETVDEPLLTVRVVWLEGLIHDGLGEVAAAARCYRSVRDTFIAQGIGYDAALVSLDLALLYLREGRGWQARQLAEEMLPIFRSRGIHREALAALRIFQEALAQETATAALAREVAAYLKTARRAPEMAFRPEGE